MKYKSLEITDEEKESLKKYCECEHRYINLLTSGDMEAIDKLNNSRLNIFSKEYFLEGMKTLKNIYSAMVKYTYGENTSAITTLARGTNLSEIEYIERNRGKCNKLLSTTTDEVVAKQHSGSKVINKSEEQDNKNAIIWIRIDDKNLPYINVNHVLGSESNHDNEEEIIIAPFCQFKGLEHISSWAGYEYYRAKVEKQVLSDIDKQSADIRTFEDKIGEIPNLIKRYMLCKSKYDSLAEMAKYQTSREEKKLIQKEQEDNLVIMKEAEKEFNEIRQNMLQYAKSICYEVREKVEEEVHQETVQMKRDELTRAKEANKSKLQEHIKVISNSVILIGENTKKYKNIASMLGIEWETSISQEKLEQIYEEIQQCSTELEDNINYIESEVEEEKLDEQLHKISEYQNQVNSISGDILKINESTYKYNDISFEKQIRTELNSKVENLIKESKIQNISTQIIELEGRKVGLLGKIFGKDKEIELKKQQLILTKNLLELEPVQENEDCSADEIMAKIMYYQKQNNGELTEPLKAVKVQMTKVFQIDNEEVEKLVNEKLNRGELIPIQESKSIFRKKTNNILEQANQKLENELQQFRRTSDFKFKIHNQYKEKSIYEVEKVYHIMQSIKNRISQDKEKDKLEQKQI